MPSSAAAWRLGGGAGSTVEGSSRAMAPGAGLAGVRRCGSASPAAGAEAGAMLSPGWLGRSALPLRGVIRSVADTGLEAWVSMRSAWRKNSSRSTMATPAAASGSRAS
jgi:hypothetical protein